MKYIGRLKIVSNHKDPQFDREKKKNGNFLRSRRRMNENSACVKLRKWNKKKKEFRRTTKDTVLIKSSKNEETRSKKRKKETERRKGNTPRRAWMREKCEREPKKCENEKETN